MNTPLKSLLVNEFAKLLEILLGLAGEADDKGRSYNDIRDLAAKLCNHLADHFSVAVTVHCGKHAVRDVLHGQVNVFENPVVIAHLCNKLVGYLVGIAVKYPYPRYARRLGDPSEQLGKLVFPVKIKTVAGGVLRNYRKLLYAKSLKVACLLNYILHLS